MRSLQSLLVGGLLTSIASALEAQVYTFGPHSAPANTPAGGKTPSLSPANARLYFAERLGLSQFHSLRDADEETLELLSAERSTQAPLFGDHEGEAPIRALIIVEGVEDIKNAVIDGAKPVFTIHNPPSLQSTRVLVEDLLDQEHKRLESYGSVKEVPGQAQHTPGSFKYASTQLTNLLIKTKHLGYKGAATAAYIKAEELSERGFEYLRSFQTGMHSVDITVVLMPPAAKSSKRSYSSWGSYDKPQNIARAAQDEAPLTEASTMSPSEKASSIPIDYQAVNSSKIPKTTIPVCYNKNSTCQEKTLNCMGHGYCDLKFTDGSDDNNEGASCYACVCGKTVIDQDFGQKTIYWGGAACQKKDVSMPFWLIAGFTVAIVSAITWGIGLLYSIGQQDLPSVLGAGVAGPSARK